MAKSPSDFSCHSYELFVGQEKGNDDNNKEKMSIRSEGLESVSEMQKPTNSVPSAGTMAKVRKVSTVSSQRSFGERLGSQFYHPECCLCILFRPLSSLCANLVRLIGIACI